MAVINCPTNSMCDEKIKIGIQGLPPDKIVTLHGHAIIDNGNMFESLALYKTDSTGCIDLSKDQSLGGTYNGVDTMGLFWSMQESFSNKYENQRFVKIDVTTPLNVTITVYDIAVGSLKEMVTLKEDCGDLKRFKLTSACIHRWLLSKGTKRIPLSVKQHGLHGALFVPDGPGPFPGVIVTFGGYPGTLEFKAALLSSHGFVTMALAFYGEEGLPTEIFLNAEDKLHLEYFEHAVDFLSDHKSVDAQRGVGILSLSFSTAVALALAEYSQKVTCVIWMNGTFQPSACKIYCKDKIIKPMIQDLYEVTGKNRLRGFFESVKCHKVENKWINNHDYIFNFQNQHDVAYMFIASLNDESVPSEHYVNWAEFLLKEAKHPNFTILRYPGAGHLVEPPFGIHNKITSIAGLYLLDWGGITKPHCKAQEASWGPQIEFLKKNLASTKTCKL